MRVRALLLALILWGCGAQADTPRGAIHVDAAAVPLRADKEASERHGAFAYSGGLHLTSPDTSRLGGLSDLRVAQDGGLIVISDAGDVLRARLRLKDGRVAGMEDATLTPLTGLDGAPLQAKAQGDAEGLAVWPNGDLMISFERDHRIWLYPADGGSPSPAPMPDILMPDNEGMEGLALAPSRGLDAYWVGIEGGSIWLCRLSAACDRDDSQVRPPLGYRLVGLAETPEGMLVVLHHGWDPFRGSRIVLWITQPAAGRKARVLAKLTLGKPFTVDNFEGVDAVLAPTGGLRLMLISDDNFSASQKTLLMAFDWMQRSRSAGSGQNKNAAEGPSPLQR